MSGSSHVAQRSVILQVKRKKKVHLRQVQGTLFGRTMGLVSTQILTGIRKRISPEDKDGRRLGLTTLPPSCADCLEILGALTSWSPKDLVRPVIGKL